jgi:GTPase SAR1 family protein
LKSSFTSETDKQLLNTGLYNITVAKTESSANSAVITLKATIAATQNIISLLKIKQKQKQKRKAEAAKAAAEKVEAERKAAEKAEADRKSCEVAQPPNLKRQHKLKQQMSITQLLVSGQLKMAILGIRKGHSTVIPPGGSLPPGYH